MKNRIYLLVIGGLLLPVLMFAQQIDKREKYDISKDKVLYTIGYAHLDTEWNWEYPTTINEYIKNTMEDNFRLLEKYPDRQLTRKPCQTRVPLSYARRYWLCFT